MLIRRAFYLWQPAAVVVLPVWLLAGWGVFGPDGWPFLVLLIVCPLLAAAMFVVALLGFVRPSVRAHRASSWLDVALVGAWHLVIVGIGFFGDGNSTLIVLSILLGLAAFWSAVWQLVTDARRRLQDALGGAPQRGGGAARPAAPIDDGEYIVIPERRRGER